MNKKYLIHYSAFIAALLVCEMVTSNFQALYVVRLFYPLLIISLMTGAFKIIKGAMYFYASILFYFAHSVLYLDNALVQAELVNIVWWVLFMFIVNHLLTNKYELEIFLDYFLRYTFYSTFIGSAIGLYKLYKLSQGVVITNMETQSKEGYSYVIAGTSLNADYNIYSFGVFFGVLAGWLYYLRSRTIWGKAGIAAAMLSMTASAMLSSSRRGLVVGGILLILFIFLNLRKGLLVQAKSKWARIPWLPLISIVVILYGLYRFDFASFLQQTNESRQVFDRLSTVSDITSGEQDNRSPRWAVAFDLYEEQPLIAQLFGGGFDYSTVIGNTFLETEFDHPHNVYISALLYSGGVGLLVAILTTFYGFIFYYVNRKYIGIVGIWFLLLLFLNLTSSNSIFSGRFCILLFLLPYLDVFSRIKNSELS